MMTAKARGISSQGKRRWFVSVGDWGHIAPARKGAPSRDPALGPDNSVRVEVSLLGEDGYLDTEHLSLVVWVRADQGVLSVEQLMINPGHAHKIGGLVTTDLRDIPLLDISREVLARVRTGESPSGWEIELSTGETVRSPFTPPPPPRGWATNLAKRPGRAGKPDLYYALFAVEYVQLLDQPKPLIRLAKKRRLSPSQARSILYEARRRQLLTDPPVKGRAGGELTSEAIDILRQYEQGTET
jgi:hypothetical protein